MLSLHFETERKYVTPSHLDGILLPLEKIALFALGHAADVKLSPPVPLIIPLDGEELARALVSRAEGHALVARPRRRLPLLPPFARRR